MLLFPSSQNCFMLLSPFLTLSPLFLPLIAFQPFSLSLPLSFSLSLPFDPWRPTASSSPTSLFIVVACLSLSTRPPRRRGKDWGRECSVQRNRRFHGQSQKECKWVWSFFLSSVRVFVSSSVSMLTLFSFCNWRKTVLLVFPCLVMYDSKTIVMI